ncbi:transglycosylase SLT domain-containing protein [Trinickia dinghuensis]|uniref:Lytic transglycosylase domain-containing protein n=1 Tax=Trinickia dinghuensis TaxID=2291023 RepID=A0A3D8JT94_9BURK|nr:transglycosylase SLT domain-containing protein [Trinickia dinghuensis]RDU96090.1 lytic transglycosylase domain-containing protein [Trinickia dinghuensis]
MNTWLSSRSDDSFGAVVRAALRRGTRVSHHLFSIVGVCAVLVGLALWLLPTVRGTLAARMMPFIEAAVQAGPARLLSGHPLPAFGVPSPSSEGADGAPTLDNTRYDGAFDGSGASGLSMAAAPAADTHLPASITPSNLYLLAKMISSQPVSADARDDRVLVSTREQALVTSYLSRRYHVAQEPVGDLVKAAFDTGRQVGLDPLLLLAVMAIESGFNPYAESGVGAQGLMQVMSKVHSDKFQYFGGTGAALEPLANITVGAVVLKDCIARGGSLTDGLRLYVGSTSQDDGGYGAKVLAERGRLRDVARGRQVPINAPQAPQKPVLAATKRVQVALNSNHPATAQVKTSAANTSSTPVSDDDGGNANQPHPSNAQAELGA